jgi:hypothetical protein
MSGFLSEGHFGHENFEESAAAKMSVGLIGTIPRSVEGCHDSTKGGNLYSKEESYANPRNGMILLFKVLKTTGNICNLKPSFSCQVAPQIPSMRREFVKGSALLNHLKTTVKSKA